MNRVTLGVSCSGRETGECRIDGAGVFESNRRLHSTPGYVSPMLFEKNWFAAQLGCCIMNALRGAEHRDKVKT